jgi:hypothetical protein
MHIVNKSVNLTHVSKEFENILITSLLLFYLSVYIAGKSLSLNVHLKKCKTMCIRLTETTS